MPAPDFLSVREAARVLRIGKTCAYELAQQFLHTDWIDQPAHTRRAELTGELIRPPSALNGE